MVEPAELVEVFVGLGAEMTVRAALLDSIGFKEWARHIRRDAELAGMRAASLAAEHNVTVDGDGDHELQDVPAVIAEAHQADTSDPTLDHGDLVALERALDALETAHDERVGKCPIRDCECDEAEAWRRARHVTMRVRGALGLKQRLLDRV